MRSMAPIVILVLILLVQLVLYLVVGPEAVQGALQSVSAAFGINYNTFLVLMGTALLGMAAGLIGSFAVLRKRSLVGDAVAHASLPGLGIAFLVVGSRQFGTMLFGAMVAGLIGTLVITWLQKNTRIKADAAIGIVLSVFYGLGISISRIIQDDPTGQQAGLDSFLLGKTAGMVSQDILLITVVAANVLIFTLLFYKEFKLLSFDTGFATVQGWPVLFLDTLLLGLLVLTVVIGLPAVGVVLMAAMVIIPGVSARFWTDRLGIMLILAAVFGTATGIMGTLASARYSDFPAGAVIVLSGAAIFVISMFVAPKRGIVARLWDISRFRMKVARQNLLRTLYEASEHDIKDKPGISIDKLLASRSWKGWQASLLLRLGVMAGDIEKDREGWRLSEKGVQNAADVVKSHRLWELYLVQAASVAADHVDRDADEIEHVLTPEILARLEASLQQSGQWPEPAMASSVHPIDHSGRV